MTQFTLTFTIAFTLRRTQIIDKPEIGEDERLNLHTRKTPDWAGATPVWTRLRAQRVCGVVPA